MVFKNLFKKYVMYNIGNMDLPDFEDSPIVRKKVIFSGDVQNIGFRFETYQIANKLGLTGFVKNIGNTIVEAEFQGEDNRISFLIEYMKKLKRATISDLKIDELAILDNEIDFNIIY